MKILTPGHYYALPQFENSEIHQFIQFIEKQVNPSDGNLCTINDGTTNEEVLAMIIDRLHFLQAKFPCKENAVAITHIETALLWLEKRTADRKARGVEGQHKA